MSAPSGTGSGAPTWPGLLNRLLAREDLPRADTSWAMREVMTGEATPSQIAGFVVALRAKGESPEEVAGLAASMLEQATPVSLPRASVDIVGTGGDGAHTVNISTMAAVVTAATGVPVAKHGTAPRRRPPERPTCWRPSASSSICRGRRRAVRRGGGDRLFFAPVFHPGMRHAGPTRREMGIGTVFNFLGPLTNPARPVAAAVGCADLRMARCSRPSWPRGAPAPWSSAVTTGWTS